MTDEGQAQERLNSFLRSHRVLQVLRRDFPEGWGFCIEWMDGTAGGAGTPFAAYQREKVDYMKVLPPEVFARFSELRKRRKEIAEADGVKPFVVMTDAQLAKAAEFEKPTVADLKKIEGFGEAKDRVIQWTNRLWRRSVSRNPESSVSAALSLECGGIAARWGHRALPGCIERTSSGDFGAMWTSRPAGVTANAET